MGTHPIFESDFDCLTEMKSVSNEIGNGNKRNFRVPTRIDESKSVTRERRACTQRNAVQKDDFHRLLVNRDGKTNLGFWCKLPSRKIVIIAMKDIWCIWMEEKSNGSS